MVVGDVLMYPEALFRGTSCPKRSFGVHYVRSGASGYIMSEAELRGTLCPKRSFGVHYVRSGASGYIN
jgi:hypothetical protein